MKTNLNKPFNVKLQFENNYYRLYITHPLLKGRIRKRIGNRPQDEVESMSSYLKFELGKHFMTNQIVKEDVESFIDNYISLNIKCNASIFEYSDEFIQYKTFQTNKKTKKKLAKSTISGYLTAINYFEKFLMKKKISPHPSNLTESVLNDYYDFIKGEHNYKVKLHTKLKGFLIFLEKEKNLTLAANYKKSSFVEQYDNQCPEEDDKALDKEDVYKLIELRMKFLKGEIELERFAKSNKLPEELQERQFNMKKENIVKCLDCFLFMISTGMYYADVRKSYLNISTTNDPIYIKYRRAKNDSLCKAIPLSNEDIFIGKEIMSQYKIKNGSNFPLNLSLTHFDKHLERIGKLAGITYKITNKMARKTFASYWHFEKELPIQYLQTMLGHKDVKDTAHYLRISDDDIVDKIMTYLHIEKTKDHSFSA